MFRLLAELWADSSVGVALCRVETYLGFCTEDLIVNAQEAAAHMPEFKIWTAGNQTEALLTGLCGAVPGLYAWVRSVAWNCRIWSRLQDLLVGANGIELRCLFFSVLIVPQTAACGVVLERILLFRCRFVFCC